MIGTKSLLIYTVISRKKVRTVNIRSILWNFVYLKEYDFSLKYLIYLSDSIKILIFSEYFKTDKPNDIFLLENNFICIKFKKQERKKNIPNLMVVWRVNDMSKTKSNFHVSKFKT